MKHRHPAGDEQITRADNNDAFRIWTVAPRIVCSAWLGLFLVQLAIYALVMAVLFWKVFAKAGQPGWAAIVPIYNIYIWLKIAGRPGWWLLLLFIPIVNFVIAIIANIDVAKAFGKGTGFALGLTFLGFIFYPILGFGSATYTAPVRPSA